MNDPTETAPFSETEPNVTPETVGTVAVSRVAMRLMDANERLVMENEQLRGQLADAHAENALLNERLAAAMTLLTGFAESAKKVVDAVTIADAHHAGPKMAVPFSRNSAVCTPSGSLIGTHYGATVIKG